MNLFGLSPGELLLIMMVAMIVLGPEKLPEVIASVGKWVREFRRATEELTSQFTEDNPLFELQRVFSLDEPKPAAPVEAAPENAATEYSAVAPAPVPQIAGPVESDYFKFPATYIGISDVWTHGSLAPDGIYRNGHHNGYWLADDDRSIADEWIFGIPIPPARPAPESPAYEFDLSDDSENGSAADAVATEEPASETEFANVSEADGISPDDAGWQRSDEIVDERVPAVVGDGGEGDHS